MIEFKITLYGLLIGWLFTNFDPIQDLLKNYVKPKVKFEYIKTALSCLKCSSFYFTFVVGAYYYQFAFFEAILASVIAFTFEKLIFSLKTYL